MPLSHRDPNWTAEDERAARERVVAYDNRADAREAALDRLSPRIAHARKCLADRVRLDGAGPLPDTLDLAVFERTLDNSLSEHFAYQTAQSRAFATGKLSMYEAQVIYIALGEAPGTSGWAAGTDLATKLIVTEALTEIVGIR